MFRWYAINTYSGHENKVKTNLEHRIDSMNQHPRFRRVVVPTEQVIETKDGQKAQTEKRILHRYGLDNMYRNDDAWTAVKNTTSPTCTIQAGHTAVPSPPGPRAARRARRQHHGVVQGVQRPARRPERPHHPGRDHGLRGSLVRLHHEDPAGGSADQGGIAAGEGLRRAEPGEGWAP